MSPFAACPLSFFPAFPGSLNCLFYFIYRYFIYCSICFASFTIKLRIFSHVLLIFIVSPSLLAFPAAAPVAPGGREPPASHHVQLQWSDLELCTPGSLPSCVTTLLQCPLSSPSHRLPRSSPRTLLSRTQLCPQTRLPIPSPSWRRLGGGWRRRGGGTHYSRPSRGRCQVSFISVA